MVQKKYITNFILFLTFFILFLFFSLGRAEIWRLPQSIMFATLIVISSIPTTFMLKKNLNIDLRFLVVYYLFIVSCITSALLKNDFNLLVNTIFYFFLYISSFIVIPSLFKSNINKFLFFGILFSHIIVLCVPGLLYGFDIQPYQGIFNNPNTLGVTTTTVYGVILSYVLFIIEKKIIGSSSNKIKLISFILLIVSLLFVLYLIVISGSRTSFISVILLFVIGMVFLSINVIKNKDVFSLVWKGAPLVFISIGLVIWYIRNSNSVEYILGKFTIS